MGGLGNIIGGIVMYHYDYVSRKQAAPIKEELREILLEVQDEVRDKFTFQFHFIGSSSRNMITYDPTTNKGFDFDVNIEPNDDDEEFSPKEIRDILRNAINLSARKRGYSDCEDSTRVLTIKHINHWQSRIEYSCDFAIVFDSKEGQQYIRYNKQDNSYYWAYQKQPYKELNARAEKLRKGHWDEVLDVYLYKKNNNTDLDKKSRSLYAETINEIYKKYF